MSERSPGKAGMGRMEVPYESPLSLQLPCGLCNQYLPHFSLPDGELTIEKNSQGGIGRILTPANLSASLSQPPRNGGLRAASGLGPVTMTLLSHSALPAATSVNPL